MTLGDGTRLLYRQDQLPVFQNRCYDTAEEARACPKGDVRLVEDLTSGLVYNAAFRPELIVYDANYQNEQAVPSASGRGSLPDPAYDGRAKLGRSRLRQGLFP